MESISSTFNHQVEGFVNFFFLQSVFLSISSLVLGSLGLRYECRSKESTDKVCIWELAFKYVLHDRQQNGLPSAGDLGRSLEISIQTAITIQKKLSNQLLRITLNSHLFP